jgi:hypothetical protein
MLADAQQMSKIRFDVGKGYLFKVKFDVFGS